MNKCILIKAELSHPTVILSASITAIVKRLASVTCARYAEVGHDNSNCKNEECCAYYKGDHSAFSR